jgi:hypothetical protein
MSMEVTREQAEAHKRALVDAGKLVRAAIAHLQTEYDRHISRNNQASCTATKSIEKLMGQCHRTEIELQAISIGTFIL